MICRRCNIENQTESRARNQHGRGAATNTRSQNLLTFATPTENTDFWSPMTAGPYLVPVSRWIE